MPDAFTSPRKPRIALMGEFSAGKSSLTNLLLGGRPLPVQVTATRLPPVWISHGEEFVELVDHQGQTQELPLAELRNVSVKDAQLIRVQLPVETLELCDLIDMPGISDPNMPGDVWEKILPEVDSLLWCTPAQQAWRQSEAAFWSMLRPQLKAPATLVLTHFDKLLTERDQARVLHRLDQETAGEFAGIFPLSMPLALDAGEDLEAWQNSGADRFVEHLVNILLHWDSHLLPAVAPEPEQAPIAAPQTAEDTAADMALTRAATSARILPRRVRPHPKGTPRPDRPEPRAHRECVTSLRS